MPQEIYNHSWFTSNETRNYPLDGNIEVISDSGDSLPMGIIADLKLIYPSSLEDTPYLAAVTITDNLATVVFASGGRVIAVASIKQKVIPFSLYPLESLYNGVVGHIVFGSAVNLERGVWRFSSSNQSKLSVSAASSYPSLPLTGFSVYGNSQVVAGDVSFAAGTDVIISVEGQDIIFSLDTSDESSMSKYLGECDVRPESGTCARTSIRSIGGVTPDCTGNIQINVFGLNQVWSGSEMYITSSKRLKDVCDKTVIDWDGPEDKCVSGLEVESTAFDFNILMLAANNTSGVIWDSIWGITNATEGVPSKLLFPENTINNNVTFTVFIPESGGSFDFRTQSSSLSLDKDTCVINGESFALGSWGEYTISVTSTGIAVSSTRAEVASVSQSISFEDAGIILEGSYCSNIEI